MPYPTFLNNWLTLGFLTAEAQAVMTMRMLGMMGLWPVAQKEVDRMLNEKPAALLAAQIRMAKAISHGQSPDAVIATGLKPFRQAPRANARRLKNRATR